MFPLRIGFTGRGDVRMRRGAGLRLERTTMRLLLTSVLILAFASATISQPPGVAYPQAKGKSPGLAGKWVRVGDEAAGSVVEVKYFPATGLYQGRLVKTAGKLTGVFFNGDVKWRDVRQVSETGYQGKDLFKAPRADDGTITATYQDFTLELKAGKLESRQLADTNQFGTVQRWKKLK